jgi:transposase
MGTYKEVFMAARRLSMRKIRDILRLDAQGCPSRTIAQSVGIGETTVRECLTRALRAGLVWPLPDDLDDAVLESRLYPPPIPSGAPRPEPDWADIHQELRRPHVTLMLLWEEHKTQHPDGYQYSQFAEKYRRFAKRLPVWMRQEHKGGEKLFVDWAGDKIPYTDAVSGEKHEASLFVAVMGASSKTFAWASPDERESEWLRNHVKAAEFFKGVTALTVPDQLRTGVKTPCRYDPEIHPAYAEWAEHYGTCVMPARPAHPKDKPKVEAGVLVAERWIIASLRNRVFTSVAEINAAMEPRLQWINARPMRQTGRSRDHLFEALDRPHLRPLPEKRYEYAMWKVNVGVHMDHHIQFDRHFYSAPFTLAHEKVDVRATADIVEIFYKHQRVFAHVRSYVPWGYTTEPSHRPKAHQDYARYKPSDLITWAGRIGLAAAKLVETIMTERPHPEQGFRACLGILRLGKRFGEVRLEKACARALAIKSHAYRTVESILKNHTEEALIPPPKTALPSHENVRGPGYYH